MSRSSLSLLVVVVGSCRSAYEAHQLARDNSMLRLELCKFTQSVLNIVAVAPLPRRSASNAVVAAGGGRGGGGGGGSAAVPSMGRRRSGGGAAAAAAETMAASSDDAEDNTTEESCCFPLELAEARM